MPNSPRLKRRLRALYRHALRKTGPRPELGAHIPIVGGTRSDVGGPGLELPRLVNTVVTPRLARAALVPDRGSADAEATFARGGVYVHVHCTASAHTEGGDDAAGLWVEPKGADLDSYIAPGGREADQHYRFGLTPGGTFSCSVDLVVPSILRGPISSQALTLQVGVLVDGVPSWRHASTIPAAPEPGRHRLHVTSVCDHLVGPHLGV